MSKEALRQMMESPNGGLVGRSISDPLPPNPKRNARIAEFEHDAEEALTDTLREGDHDARPTVAPALKVAHSAEDAWFPSSRWQRLKMWYLARV